MEKSCCVTGHNDIPAGQLKYVKEELRREIMLAVQDGYTHFICGAVCEVDLIFAGIISELKTGNPDITLEAAVSHRRRMKDTDKKFQNLIQLCDSIQVVSEIFSRKALIKRNMYMVDKSERIIAVYDGRESGGTEYIIRYAKKQKREINIIAVEK